MKCFLQHGLCHVRRQIHGDVPVPTQLTNLFRSAALTSAPGNTNNPASTRDPPPIATSPIHMGGDEPTSADVRPFCRVAVWWIVLLLRSCDRWRPIFHRSHTCWCTLHHIMQSSPVARCILNTMTLRRHRHIMAAMPTARVMMMTVMMRMMKGRMTQRALSRNRVRLKPRRFSLIAISLLHLPSLLTRRLPSQVTQGVASHHRTPPPLLNQRPSSKSRRLKLTRS